MSRSRKLVQVRMMRKVVMDRGQELHRKSFIGRAAQQSTGRAPDCEGPTRESLRQELSRSEADGIRSSCYELHLLDQLSTTFCNSYRVFSIEPESFGPPVLTYLDCEYTSFLPCTRRVLLGHNLPSSTPLAPHALHVHGYARRPDLAEMSNLLHMALAGLQTRPWFEWVPSKANPADLPSRPPSQEEIDFYSDMNVQPWPHSLRLPTLRELATPMIDVASIAQQQSQSAKRAIATQKGG